MYITIFTEFLNLGREKTSDRCGWGNWTAAGRCQSDPDYCLWYGIPVSQTWTTWVDISYVHCPLSPLWTIFCLLPFFAASFPFLILIFRLLTKLMKTSKGTLLKTQCLNFAAKYVETYFVNMRSLHFAMNWMNHIIRIPNTHLWNRNYANSEMSLKKLEKPFP